MSEFKTFNDGYCHGCGDIGRLYQAEDWGMKNEEHPRRRYCPKCLWNRFALRVYEDQTVWGEVLTKEVGN